MTEKKIQPKHPATEKSSEGSREAKKTSVKAVQPKRIRAQEDGPEGVTDLRSGGSEARVFGPGFLFSDPAHPVVPALDRAVHDLRKARRCPLVSAPPRR